MGVVGQPLPGPWGEGVRPDRGPPLRVHFPGPMPACACEASSPRGQCWSPGRLWVLGCVGAFCPPPPGPGRGRCSRSPPTWAPSVGVGTKQPPEPPTCPRCHGNDSAHVDDGEREERRGDIATDLKVGGGSSGSCVLDPPPSSWARPQLPLPQAPQGRGGACAPVLASEFARPWVS